MLTMSACILKYCFMYQKNKWIFRGNLEPLGALQKNFINIYSLRYENSTGKQMVLFACVIIDKARHILIAVMRHTHSPTNFVFRVGKMGPNEKLFIQSKHSRLCYQQVHSNQTRNWINLRNEYKQNLQLGSDANIDE